MSALQKYKDAAKKAETSIQELKQQVAAQTIECALLKDQRDMLLLLSVADGRECSAVLTDFQTLFPDLLNTANLPELRQRLLILLGKQAKPSKAKSVWDGFGIPH